MFARGRGAFRRQNSNNYLNNSQRQTKRQNVTESQRLRQLVNGRELVPSVMPPVLKFTPWNNLTARYRASISSVTLGTGDLVSIINFQTGLVAKGATSFIPIEMKIQNIQVWATGETTLTLWPQDLIAKNNLELTRIDSISMKNMYARAGYEWPISHQQVTFTGKDKTTTSTKVCMINCGAATVCEVHLKVLWRPGNPPSETTFSFDSLVKNARTTKEELENLIRQKEELISQFEVLEMNE